ncbi:MAG: gamma-glutamyl-gamma-aminobutyrate hydrolase family protein [Bacteroidia bacterium]|nr:gamma-glutamyl-gamma-aminobutyrate hydrolase family protein [Bacteroidia bacterium]
MKKIIIGVTDCSKYENYARWIQSHGPDIQTIKLSEKIQNLSDASQCHGILFTGGEDVHPRFYNKPEFFEYCHEDDVSEQRDEFEMKLMEYTEGNSIPVLGICRGLQIYNVFRGGTLIPDIPTWEKSKTNHAKAKDGSDSNHIVILKYNSWLSGIVGELKGETNSNHHQSADAVGKGLVISGLSDDGIVEAIDQLNAAEKSFLCLVQWHPERMKDQNSPFVKNIREAFITAAQKLV